MRIGLLIRMGQVRQEATRLERCYERFKTYTALPLESAFFSAFQVNEAMA